ncbi:MAG TPA: aldo/keto reductase [Alphaproteobacteria bacterium]|jgi:aryl-alcohol dehydrogenase-like predicted oxidoreductase
MELRRFGASDLMVSPLGLGCMGMSGAYGAGDDAESLATIDRALELGVNFLDTSASYGNGHNQQLLAKAIKGRRDKFVIHSKSGSPREKDMGAVRGGSGGDYLIGMCEDSLKRLGIDCIDVWCMSRVDPGVPIEDSVGAMAKLVAQGKARYIGLSEASGETVRRARKVHPIVSLQMEYSLFSRDAEAGNLQVCREFGMAFMAYAPLNRGLLTGMFRQEADLPADDRRHDMPRFQAGNIERNMGLLAAVEDVAGPKGATVPQVALAWLLSRGPDVFPIPGAKTRRHLEENLKAVELVLAPDELARIDAELPPGAAAGTRYPPGQMKRVNV